MRAMTAMTGLDSFPLPIHRMDSIHIHTAASLSEAFNSCGGGSEPSCATGVLFICLSVSRRLCGPTTSCFALFAYVPARHGFALACRFECLRAARCCPPWQLIPLSVDSFGSWFPWKLIPLLLCSPHGMLTTFSCCFFCLNEYIAATVSSSHINPRVYSFQVGAPCLWWRRCLVWFRFFSNPAHRLLNLSCGNKGMLKGCR